MPLINRIGGAAAVLQEKAITTPIYDGIEITPDTDIDGLSKVTVAAQPVYEIQEVTGSDANTLVISGLKREPNKVIGVSLNTIGTSADICFFEYHKYGTCTVYYEPTANTYAGKSTWTSVYNDTDKTLTFTRSTNGKGSFTTDENYTACIFY